MVEITGQIFKQAADGFIVEIRQHALQYQKELRVGMTAAYVLHPACIEGGCLNQRFPCLWRQQFPADGDDFGQVELVKRHVVRRPANPSAPAVQSAADNDDNGIGLAADEIGSQFVEIISPNRRADYTALGMVELGEIIVYFRHQTACRFVVDNGIGTV